MSQARRQWQAEAGDDSRLVRLSLCDRRGAEQRSNALRNDLQHPNEYIRGATLRFVQKVREAELLEPLVPTVRSCLEHRHSFVRKNAVFAVYSIYQDHEHLIPDAPELLDTFLAAESDSTCKRNAFVTLCNISQPTAVRYLLANFDQIPGMDELMQMAVIELVRKEAKTEGGHRVRTQPVIIDSN